MNKFLVSGLVALILQPVANAKIPTEQILLNLLDNKEIPRETFRNIVDALPGERPIFSRLETRRARREMARYAIRLDETNKEKYFRAETGCDYDELDNNPNAQCFNCRQFTLQTKYNLRGLNSEELVSRDPLYEITPLEPKYQIPEVFRVSYVGELPNNEITGENRGVFEHAVNAIYLGDPSVEFASRTNPKNWLIFEPQTDQSFSKRKVSYRADGTRGFASIISNDVDLSPLDRYARMPTEYDNSLGEDSLHFFYGPNSEYPKYVGTGYEKALLMEVLSPQGNFTSYVEGQKPTVKDSEEILRLAQLIEE